MPIGSEISDDEINYRYHKVGSEVNSEKGERSTYVSPDESYLITANTYIDEEEFAVSFKNNNKWQTPIYFDIGEL